MVQVKPNMSVVDPAVGPGDSHCWHFGSPSGVSFMFVSSMVLGVALGSW